MYVNCRRAGFSTSGSTIPTNYNTLVYLTTSLGITSKRSIPTLLQRVSIMQTHIPRTRHDHLCRFDAVLQRPRHRTIPRNTYQDEIFYHGYRVDILKDAISFPGVSLQFLHRSTHQYHKEPNLVDPKKGLRHAEMCSRRRAKSCLH